MKLIHHKFVKSHTFPSFLLSLMLILSLVSFCFNLLQEISELNTQNKSNRQFSSYILSADIGNESLPIITSPGDLIFFEYDPVQDVNWTISDVNCSTSANYSVLLNFTPIDNYTNISWSSGEVVVVSLLNVTTLRAYNLTLIVEDGWGAQANDNILITITPNENPVISCNVGHFRYFGENYSGDAITLIWTITDPHVINPRYSITCDSEPLADHQDQSWYSGQRISIRTSRIVENEYTYFINTTDGYGGVQGYLVELWWDKTGIVGDVIVEIVKKTVPGFEIYWLGFFGIISISLYILKYLIHESKKGPKEITRQ